VTAQDFRGGRLRALHESVVIVNAPEPLNKTCSAPLAERPAFVNVSVFDCELPAVTDPKSNDEGENDNVGPLCANAQAGNTSKMRAPDSTTRHARRLKLYLIISPSSGADPYGSDQSAVRGSPADNNR
jgi:hypothetical protein